MRTNASKYTPDVSQRSSVLVTKEIDRVLRDPRVEKRDQADGMIVVMDGSLDSISAVLLPNRKIGPL